MLIEATKGNHAQGVAFSARKLKIPATIVMPNGTPAIKHKNVSRLGGSVVLHGQDFDSAKDHAAFLQKQHGLTSIPPFDDAYVIAGQGTIGMELLRQTNLTQLEAVFCCVGGGGLIAGVGVYIKRIAPHVKIIGVETHDANAMVASLAAGKRVTLRDVGLFADGAAVKSVGEESFRVCQEVIDDVIQVGTDEICAAIKDVFEDTRSILEPAGALALAGLKKYVSDNPSADPSALDERGLVAIASGANMNFDRLRFVAERAALGEHKEALLAVTIPERPGAFAELVQRVVPAGITEFCYRYFSPHEARVILGVTLDASATATGGGQQDPLAHLIAELHDSDMQAIDLSTSELAKDHVRYLVGGRTELKNERLYSFSFPERPGSLHRFLTEMQPRQLGREGRLDFNVTLFHYRNLGGDVAKILAGIQVGGGDEGEEQKVLEEFLLRVGYPYTEETDSEVYKMFLRA